MLDYMEENPNDPLSEMKQKGYFWDSFFLNEDDHLYMVLKSPDFSKIMTDDADLIATKFRAVYEGFRSNCWIEGTYQDIAPLYCFNGSLTFMGSSIESEL